MDKKKEKCFVTIAELLPEIMKEITEKYKENRKQVKKNDNSSRV